MGKIWAFLIIFVTAALVLITCSERQEYSYEVVTMADGPVTYSTSDGMYHMTIQVAKKGGILTEVSVAINTDYFADSEEAITTWTQLLPRSSVFNLLRPNFTAYLPGIDAKGLDIDSIAIRIANKKWQRP